MPEFRMSSAQSPAVYTRRYSAFRGVDFSVDPCRVEDDRSPWAVNIIADAGGCPQKRPGWRKLAKVEGKIHGIHRFETIVESEEDENGNKASAVVNEFIVHASDKLYRWKGGEDAPVVIMQGLKGDISKGFMHKDSLYILTGEEYLYVKATLAVGESQAVVTAGNVADGDEDAVYVPLRTINATPWYVDVTDIPGYKELPDASGTVHDELNAATNFRKIRVNFERSKIGVLDGMLIGLDEKIRKGTQIGSIEIKTEQGNVFKGDQEIPDSGNPYLRHGRAIYFVKKRPGNLGISLMADDNEEDKIAPGNACLWIDPCFAQWLDEHNDTSTFLTIKYPAETPVVELPDGGKQEYPDYYDRIRKCRTFDWYNSRLFVAGNPDYPNADFYSEVSEPTYFKDINYTEIGNDDSRILGYLPAGDQQAVIKSDSIQLQDASVYLRRAEWDEEDGYYFPLRRGEIGIGALSENCFTTLVDDRMYLSKDGVMGVICENITGERVVHTRSTRVNSKLLKEPGLDKAVCCVWDGYMIIAVNGNAYVADSRQKSYARNVAGNFEYEWYYWQDFPAVCFAVHDENLFFGTDDGRLCRLNTDLERAERYSDFPEGISGAPVGICAVWSTKFDDDGDFMVKKNMRRRGCGIFLKGAENCTVKVQVRTDYEYMHDLAERAHGVYDTAKDEFYGIDASLLPPGPVGVNKKVKKYSVIQVICTSSKPGDEFGILGIERRFVKGRFVK